MPMGPHRTSTVAVNLAALELRFEDGDEVTLEALVEKGVIKNTRTDVKILGQGELKKKLSVTAHGFSASARQKIEQAGGTATALRPPRKEKRRKRTAKPTPEAEPLAEEAPEPDETPDQEST
jgi:large subunit ribosomal protein L15